MTVRRRTSRRTAATPPAFASAPRALEEMIAARAHELFVQRGSIHGRDLDDWLQAEAALQRELQGGRKPNN